MAFLDKIYILLSKFCFYQTDSFNFISPYEWDFFGDLISWRTSMKILLFDGHCNLCQATVRFVLEREKTSEIRFAALQSMQGKLLLTKYGISEEYDHSLVLLDNGECLIKSDAALQTASYLNLPWCLMKLFRFLPKRYRDRFYDLVAGKRYLWFGRQEECLVPSPELKLRFLEDGYVDEFADPGEGWPNI